MTHHAPWHGGEMSYSAKSLQSQLRPGLSNTLRETLDTQRAHSAGGILDHLLRASNLHLDLEVRNFAMPASRPLLGTSEIIGATVEMPAYLNVPVRLCNGTVDGVLRCFDLSGERRWSDRESAVIRGFIEVATALIERELKHMQDRSKLRKNTESVLYEDLLSVVWQPIFSLRDGSIKGIESLARFQTTPARPPDLWFREAASVGLASILEERAIEQSLQVLQTTPAPLYIACNVSADTICAGILKDVFQHRPLKRIVLEITEHDTVRDYQRLLAFLRPYREQGLRIAVDDAGAGFANFRHILNLRPDIIKLDLSLTRNIDQDASRQALVSGVIRFAQEMGSELVAEGVETETELCALQALGVDSAQGYLRYKPMRFDEVSTLLGSAGD